MAHAASVGARRLRLLVGPAGLSGLLGGRCLAGARAGQHLLVVPQRLRFLVHWLQAGRRVLEEQVVLSFVGPEEAEEVRPVGVEVGGC